MLKNAVLITGGAGFIGSNYIPYFLEQHQDTTVVNIDKLTYAGDLKNLADVQHHKNYTFVEGDICNRGTCPSQAVHLPEPSRAPARAKPCT